MSELAVNEPEANDGVSAYGAHLVRKGAVAKPFKNSHQFGMTPPRLRRFEPVGENPGYQPKIAYLTSVISGWAYSDADVMANELSYFGLPECTVDEFSVENKAMQINCTAYFVRSKNGSIGVLAFRGTVPDDVTNWLTDANTEPTTFIGGDVHSGFFKNMEPVWNYVVEAIEGTMTPKQQPASSEAPVPARASQHEAEECQAEDLYVIARNEDGSVAASAAYVRSVAYGQTSGERQPLKNLYITGHSLGGAMAVIAGARLCSSEYHDWKPLLRGIYTFGQPAVGDRSFGRTYERKFREAGIGLYRHIYRYDVVPYLPSRSVFGTYRHFGEEFFTKKPGDRWRTTNGHVTKTYRFLTPVPLKLGVSFAARRFRLLRWVSENVWPISVFGCSIDDHGPQNYIQVSSASLM